MKLFKNAISSIQIGVEDLPGQRRRPPAFGHAEPPIDTCPECGHETYVREERQCAACDFGAPEDAYCAVCGTSLSPDEHYEYNGICAYHANQAMKDD